MYAVIETGGKQYRVEVGTELEVELLDAEPGKTVTVGRVLLVADGDDASIGRPVVDGAAVSAEVVRQGRGDKVISFKYRPKARRRVKKGHRQELTVLRISDITLNGKSAAESAAKADTDAKTERQRLEEAAGRRPPRTRGSRPSWPPHREAAPAKKTESRPAAKAAETNAETQADSAKAEPRPRPRQPRRPRPRPARPHRRRRPRPPRRTTRAKAPTPMRRPRARSKKTAPSRAPPRRTSSHGHKKAGGSVKNGRDSVGQRLGVKAGDGQTRHGRDDHRPPARDDVPRPARAPGSAGTTPCSRPSTGTVKFEHGSKSKKRIRVEAAETARRPPSQRPGETGIAGDHRPGRWPGRKTSEESTPVKPDIHPQVLRSEGPLRLVRPRMDGRVDSTRAARRRVQQLPPVLHGHAEHHRHRRPGRALPEAPGAAGPQPDRSRPHDDGRPVTPAVRPRPVPVGRSHAHRRR